VSWALIVPIFAFVAVSVVIYLVLGRFNGETGAAERRLENLRDPRRRKGGDGERGRTDALRDMVERTAPALAKPLTPKTEKEMGRLKQRLVFAGFRGENATTVYLATKLFVMMIALFISGAVSLFMYGFSTAALIRILTVGGIGFYLPDIALRFITKKRQENIFLGMPDALDLMVVCVEAGLGLDQAMRKVADEMKKSYRVIAEEFGLCNVQMQMGRTRSEVLQDLGARNGVDDLRSLASILIQADKFGSSVAQALRVQSDSMRTRRRQIAEEKAQKTAVKLIFPMVLFIFPGVFVVLVGPAAINMINRMFPAMSGGGAG
jgi:tight adherence protein C